MSQTLVWENPEDDVTSWRAPCPPTGEYSIRVNEAGFFPVRFWNKLRHILIDAPATLAAAKEAAQEHYNDRPSETVKPKMEPQEHPYVFLEPLDRALMQDLLAVLKEWHSSDQESNVQAKAFYTEMKDKLFRCREAVNQAKNWTYDEAHRIPAEITREINDLLERLNKWENP